MSDTPTTESQRSDHLSLAVAMATYNGELFIRQQVQSILGQSRLPDEIVISDDHSTDDTVSIAKAMVEGPCKAAGITLTVVTHDQPAGAAANFANALKHTTADVVALADQDDWWLPHKLETLAAHFEALPDLLMVHSDADLVDEEGEKKGLRVLQSLRMTTMERVHLVSGRGMRALVRRNLVTGQTALLRRDLIDQAGPIPEGYVHDEWWALVAASQDGLLLDPRVFQHYRQHGGNEIGAEKSGLVRLRERFGEPQSAFRVRHKTRHTGLAEYLESPAWSGTPQAKKLLMGRIAHYAWQESLPASRGARLLPIIWHYLTGDYRRYRRGLFDALRDLFQPGQ
ncbi:rhamnosyltransferase [Pontimonas salivibrio]|uniref:Rhamnosyltransferase n=1 Tax=Pontimonas salivibrio TaxID=1159327 RepID=A0A2L2BSB5_9MICO|nr:glycosyltransferase [Pontimonas salivibrio]AVG24565.1 rhamnosyltransferase [Pontimonas salivibrio]